MFTSTPARAAIFGAHGPPALKTQRARTSSARPVRRSFSSAPTTAAPSRISRITCVWLRTAAP